MNIAIDGPAGAGKSTIAKLLASKLDFLYLDTGALYRSIAYKVVRSGIAVSDASAIEKLLRATQIDVRHEGGKQRVFVDGEDVSDKIRTPEISAAASSVSAHPCVRQALLDLQRDVANKTNVILDGRDIGTVVLPNAEFKFFLTASVSERAARRYKELTEKGVACDPGQIQSDIAQRDYNDMHRAVAPLKKADDAVELDTTHMSIDEVADAMLKIIRNASTK